MDTALSAFTVDTSQPGTTRVSGRLHHALCDVTGILSILDRLLGVLGIAPDAESIALETARNWPIAAESMLGGPQSAVVWRMLARREAEIGTSSDSRARFLTEHDNTDSAFAAVCRTGGFVPREAPTEP
ncbi:MAG: hypothetical protein ACJ72W_29375 [Actinoallomurus sp.]